MKINCGVVVVTIVSLLAAQAFAITPAEKCQASKLKIAGKYDFCRAKADAKAVQTANAPDYSKCDAKYAGKWTTTEAAGAGSCPTNGDLAQVQSSVTSFSACLAATLAGSAAICDVTALQADLSACTSNLATCSSDLTACEAQSTAQVLKTGQTFAYGTGSDGDLQSGVALSYTDNGDGTITDNATGLMWEKKSDDGSIHDADNTYTWGMNVFPYTMNGTMVTTFLAALNGGGGFAGYTDWRLPSMNELRSLQRFDVQMPSIDPVFNNGCMPGCSPLTCSCLSAFGMNYWSTTTTVFGAGGAWVVDFSQSFVAQGVKSSPFRVRAVRGGL